MYKKVTIEKILSIYTKKALYFHAGLFLYYAVFLLLAF